MYLDLEGNEVKCPDPNAGLYARSRSGDLVKVSIPQDYLAFQIGETAQIQSGGILQATPHCVKYSKKKKTIQQKPTTNTKKYLTITQPQLSPNKKK